MTRLGRLGCVVWAGMGLPALAGVSAAKAAPPGVDASLQARIEAIAAESGGVLGVVAEDVQGARFIGVRSDERFPMASTYKVAIGLAVVDKIERGSLRPDQTLPIRVQDLRLGASAVAEEWNPGMTRTIESLLRSMVVESDNTASDLLLRAVGGAAAVTGRLRALGIVDMDVNRSEVEMAADFSGATLPAASQFTPEKLTDLFRETPKATKDAAARRFAADRRDTERERVLADVSRAVFEAWGR